MAMREVMWALELKQALRKVVALVKKAKEDSEALKSAHKEGARGAWAWSRYAA